MDQVVGAAATGLDAGAGAPPLRRSRADVAVVIPAKNATRVLDATLACLAGQTLLPAEVVVVDDGSSDGTGELAASWADRLPVRTVRLDGSVGPGRARQVGVQATSTPLLTFLDADDLVLPDHLAELVSAYDQHGGVVTPDMVFWFPGSGFAPQTFHSQRPVRQPEDQWHDILRHNFLANASLVSREDFDAAGGYRGDFDGAEDWDLWIRVLQRGTRVTSSSATHIYRQSPSSLSRETRTSEASLALIEALLPDLEPSDREVALRTLRGWRAKVATGRALQRAREGRPLAARRTALAALAGSSPREAVRAAALVLAPRTSVRLADQRAERLWARG